MEELRRAHDRHLEVERAAEKEKEERRKARAKDERERRDRTAAERAQAGSLSIPSSSSTPAPWPQGVPITGAVDAAAQARRAAGKSASLEQVSEHSTRLRQQGEEHIQEELRRMEALRLAVLIQRGDSSMAAHGVAV
jgi:hypothetical protein